MNLADYFEKTEGLGVLATADGQGRVDAAVYSRPHFLGEDKAAFIMPDRLTHRNLQSNPRAVYLFHEDAPGYAGKRLHLTKVGEDRDPERVEALRRRDSAPAKHPCQQAAPFLVSFQVDRVRPLVGEGGPA